MKTHLLLNFTRGGKLLIAKHPYFRSTGQRASGMVHLYKSETWLAMLVSLVLFMCSTGVMAQTYNFTNAGATGRYGPTQAQINTAYSATTLSGQVTSSSGIQVWTVPSTGTYKIEAYGAQGGGTSTYPGGLGAYMSGNFQLLAGQTLNIIVGQTGETANTAAGNRGGGGGTFVWDPSSTAQPLIVAGGGGGTNTSASYTTPGVGGTTATSGTYKQDGTGSPGSNGNGATPGGAGYFTNSSGENNGTSAQAALNGGVGGDGYTATTHYGGFGGGGGGGGSPTTTYASGGGGGYSGGAGQGTPASKGGGGGGSYNAGTQQSNLAAVNAGHGKVIITKLADPVPNDAGIAAITSPTNPGCAGTSAVTVTVANFGSNQINPVAINWTVNGVAQTATNYTSTLDTAGGSGNNTATVNLGNVTITGPTTIVVWTSSPNNVSDTVNGNDTATVSIVPSLDGIYTIGGTGADYSTFTAAVNDLTTYGVCGPVVFLVNDGTYNEQIELGNVSGMSSTNTVTIKSNPANTDLAEMVYGATGTTDNYVIRFSGASYFTIDSLILTATGTSYGYVIDFAGNTDHVTIQDCEINGVSVSTTSTNYVVIYNYTAAVVENCTIENNTITGGSYQTYWYGTSTSSLEQGNIFSGNTCTGYYYMGLLSYYQNNRLIEGNTFIDAGTYASPYGIYRYYNDGESHVRGNRVINHGTGGYPYYGAYCDATPSNPAIIANNFFSSVNTATSGTLYGMYQGYSYDQNIVHNNIYVAGGNSSSNGIRYYLSNSSTSYTGNEFRNNVVYMDGPGQAVYFYSVPGSNMEASHNAYYYPNGSIGYWYPNTYTDLASMQSGTSQEANSMVVNPLYTSDTDLHVAQVALNAVATPLGITTDIDGDVRATTPDIGADEFLVPNNDVAPFAIISPLSPTCGDSSNVEVAIINGGILNLTAASINWEVNGVAQTPYLWTGNLSPASVDTVVLGFIAINDGDFINIWTSNPNGVPDSNVAQDTISTSILTGLNGTYVIGSSTSADYPDFTSAANDLAVRGVCGPVVFEAETGSYTGQMVLGPANGMSAVNTVTFRSQAMDSSLVTLSYAATGLADNFVVSMTAADYYRFEHLTFENTNTATYGTVFSIAGGSDYNKISNCVLKSNVGGTTSTYGAVIYSASDLDEYNEITNNVLENGAYGMYWRGIGTADKERGTIIRDNIVLNPYYMGIYLYYHLNPVLEGNSLSSNSAYTSGYGIYNVYCDASRIVGNHVFAANGNQWPYYGMYQSTSTGTLSTPIYIYNNIIVLSGGASTRYGMYQASVSLAYVAHNTLTIESGGTSSYAYYVSGGNSYSVENNLFTNLGQGYASYLASGSGYEYNYNNYYSATSSLVYLLGAYSTLEALQSGTGEEANGLSVDPNFTDIVYGLLCNDSLDGAGVPYAWITEDFYGTQRDILTPDIGAVAFEGLNAFSLGPDFTACGTETVLSLTAGTGVNVVWYKNNGLPLGVDPSITIGQNEPMPISVGYTNACGSASDTISISFVKDIDLDDEHICANSTVDLIGDGPGQYVWSNGETGSSITVSAPGTYSVTYTEDGCTSTDISVVTQSVKPQLSDMVHCGASVSLNATIPGGSTYNWSTGATTPVINASVSDIYTVTVTDSFACMSTASMELLILNGPPVAEFVEQHSYLTYMFDASSSTNVGPGSVYMWDFEGDGIVDYTASYPNNSAVHIYPFTPDSMNYTVVLEIVNNQCSGSPSGTYQMDLLASVGVADFGNNGGSIHVFPNPTEGQLSVLLPKGTVNADMVVTDVVGRQVMARKISSGSVTIDLGGLASGTYNLVVRSNDGLYQTKVVLK